ncbi:MAG: AmpE protein [Porticoccus sp.]|jgi:AmpE protein
MKLFSILIVFALLQYWGSGGPVQQDSWFNSIIKKLLANAAAKKVAVWLLPLLVILLPAGLLQLVLWKVDGVAFGIAELVITCTVLLYSLGRNEFNQLVETYLRSWNSDDIQGAYSHAQDFSCLKPLGSEQIEAGNLAELHKHAFTAIVYQGFERWFVVIFWFLLLGPSGALAYRLGFLYSRHSLTNEASVVKPIQALMHWVEWLPAQLLGLSFALAGNFGSCFALWRKRMTITSDSVCEMLMNYAIAALGVNEELACQAECLAADQAKSINDGNQQIVGLQQLLHRCVVLWVIALSVFILFV